MSAAATVIGSYPLLGLEGCGRAVRAHTEAAKAAVADWDTDGFLAALADSLAERNK